MISVHRRAIELEKEQVDILSEPENRLNEERRPRAEAVSAAARVKSKMPR